MPVNYDPDFIFGLTSPSLVYFLDIIQYNNKTAIDLALTVF